MKPLRVALVVKPTASTHERDGRNMGYWSYPVEQFAWEHFSPGDAFIERRDKFKAFDLIFLEDGGNWGYFTGDGPPVVYLSIDSTLSSHHLRQRQQQARQADLVLVDHDGVSQFGVKARRWNYCVNDRVFYPRQKTLDVCFHCGGGASKGMPGGAERVLIRQLLGEHCEAHRYSYVSGGVGLDVYAEHMGRAKVVVNSPRTVINRPHRVFDAMASGAALLTGPIPTIDGDLIEHGRHYASFATHAQMLEALDCLLTNNAWQEPAAQGYELVMQAHTWKIRAAQLRAMLAEELGL